MLGPNLLGEISAGPLLLRRTSLNCQTPATTPAGAHQDNTFPHSRSTVCKVRSWLPVEYQVQILDTDPLNPLILSYHVCNADTENAQERPNFSRSFLRSSSSGKHAEDQDRANLWRLVRMRFRNQWLVLEKPRCP